MLDETSDFIHKCIVQCIRHFGQNAVKQRRRSTFKTLFHMFDRPRATRRIHANPRMGELNSTFSTALKVLQGSTTIMRYDRSQCVLLALSVCALGGASRKRCLLWVHKPPPRPFGGVWGPPHPRTLQNVASPPRGQTLTRGGPCGVASSRLPPPYNISSQRMNVMKAGEESSRHLLSFNWHPIHLPKEKMLFLFLFL